MIDLEHSPLGGSAAHRFMACAGSFLMHREQLQNGQFENIESEFAQLGTAAHELAAMCLAEDHEPFEFIGQMIDGYRVGWPDGIQIDAVQVYVNECRRLMPATEFQLIEETITLPDVHPLLKGTIDFATWHPTKGLWLRDYKNGEGVGVGAVNNSQLLYYAYLLVRSNPWLLDNAPRDYPINLGIVQPNFYGIYEEPDCWETTLGYVLDWGNHELLPRMNALVEPQEYTDDDFVLGSHCLFCPVMLDCPKMQRAYREYVDATEDFVVMLTNEELDAFYANREHVKRFMNAMEQTVKARLIAGSKIPSAKLVVPKTNRVWKPGAEPALIEAFGEQAYDPKKIKSPAAIEKLSSRGKELTLEYAYKPDADRLTVAPLSDPRPEAKPQNGSDVFKSFEQTPEQMGF